MPKNVFTKRDELICGKIDKTVNIIKNLNISDNDKINIIDLLCDIQNDAQRMENKLISRKKEVDILTRKPTI